MEFRRVQVLAAVAVSVSVHVAVAGWFAPSEAEMRIEGGSAVDMMIVGNAFVDAVSAGDASAEISAETPVEASDIEQADTTLKVRESRAETTEAVTAEPVRAVETTGELVPGEPVPGAVRTVEPATEPKVMALAEVSEIAPVMEPVMEPVTELTRSVQAVKPAETASVEPAETEPVEPPEVTPARNAASELAALSDIPIPTPRPRIEPKPEPRKTVAKQPKPVEAKQLPPSRTKIASGNGGDQKTDSTRAATGSSEAKETTRAGNAAVSNYAGRIASQLRRSLRYPSEARRKGIKGTVVVSFTVSRNGSVAGVRIVRSSGSAILDRAAGDAVRRAAPFRPIPDAAGRSNWSFSVPLSFTR